MTYFATGTSGTIDNPDDGTAIQEQRRHMRQQPAQSIAPRDQHWTIVMGDFNTVTCTEDRWCKAAGAYTGDKDKREEKHWIHTADKNHGLSELHQTAATCDAAAARSRIDRIYSNHDVTEQLDRHRRVAPLE